MKYIEGYFWPDDDVNCHPAVLSEVSNLERVYPYVKEFNTVVQAGGNCGVWPNVLSGKFKSVYTFEPDAMNFRCLNVNCQSDNVIKFQAVLGDKAHLVSLETEKQNVGAHFVKGEGIIPTMRIDDLGLASCDLIYLDIEGMELFALMGSIETIKKFHPVIGIEDKSICCDRFGVEVGQTEKWLEQFGYKVVARYARDVLLAC